MSFAAPLFIGKLGLARERFANFRHAVYGSTCLLHAVITVFDSVHWLPSLLSLKKHFPPQLHIAASF